MLINIYSIGLFIVKCKQILLCIKHYYIEIICRSVPFFFPERSPNVTYFRKGSAAIVVKDPLLQKHFQRLVILGARLL